MLERLVQDLEASPPPRSLALAPPRLVPTVLAQLLLNPLNGRVPGVGVRILGRIAAVVARLGESEVRFSTSNNSSACHGPQRGRQMGVGKVWQQPIDGGVLSQHSVWQTNYFTGTFLTSGSWRSWRG